MEVLSAIAINLATGIAIEFWNGLGNNIETEIKKAFNKALKDWSPNKELREKKSQELFKYLLNLLKDENFLKLNTNPTGEYLEFYNRFKERLAEQPAAFQYLESIKNEVQFKEKINKLNKIDLTTSDSNEKINLILEIISESKKVSENSDSNYKECQDQRIVLFNNYKKECEDYYFNRDVDDRFCKLLKLGNVWLYGKSGIGKTALISRNLLINEYETIYCDFSPISITSAKELLDEVSETICEKYGIEDVHRDNNKIKNLRNHILGIENSKIVIVIDELSIDSPDLFNEITQNIVQLITHYNNFRENSSLKFVVSTIAKPEIVKAIRGKAMEHFQFSEIDHWNGELSDLLKLINNALGDFLNSDMRKIVITKSNESPRLLKAIVKKLLVLENLNLDIVSKVSNDTYNEHY